MAHFKLSFIKLPKLPSFTQIGSEVNKLNMHQASSMISDQLTITDVIAPERMEVDFSNIRVNDQLYRSFFVSNYPRYVEANWLEPLIDFDHTLTVSMYIYPSQNKGVLDDLKKKDC